MPGLKLKSKISKGAQFAKIKWDTTKHKRDSVSGRFVNKPGTDEFKAETYGPGKTSNVKNSDVVVLHVTANPKKPGSASAQRFEQYKDGMTVGEFKAAGGKLTDLAHDTKKGFITIHDPSVIKAAGPPQVDAPPPPPPPPKLGVSEYAITSKTKDFNTNDKIKILVGHNPKKPGSMAAEAFSKYKDEMTIGEFYALEGGKKNAQSHLLHDTKKGFISVHHPADLADMQSGKLSPGVLSAQMKSGDKALGVVTKNPFAPGTKNHDDFEAEAATQGLTTQAKVTAQVDPATGAAKPKLADLGDDDVLVSQYGTEYKVGQLKITDQGFTDEVNKNLDNGTWTVKPKGVQDTDVIQPVSVSTGQPGAKYTVAEYKQITGLTSAQVDGLVAGGKLKLNPAGAGVTTMKMGGSVPPPKPAAPAPKPLPKQSIADDVDIETASGVKYTVAEYKAKWKMNGLSDEEVINKVNQNLASGAITVKAKKVWADDDVIETYLGNKTTVGEYKAKWGVAPFTDSEMDDLLADGTIKLVPKLPPPPPPTPKTPTVDDLADDDIITASSGAVLTGKEVKASALGPHMKGEFNKAFASGDWKVTKAGTPVKAVTKLADVPKSEHAEWEVATTTGSNPYPPHSEEWVKFGKIHNTSSGLKSMTVQKYLSSKTNVANQEKILDQMVADGHVKFVDPAQKKAIEAQKAKYAAQAAADKIAAGKAANNVHYVQMKPADHHDDPKWGTNKVAGITVKGLNEPGIVDTMDKTRLAVDLKFNGVSTAGGAVSHYTGSGYASINSTLRKGGGYSALGPTNKEYVNKLDALMGPTKTDAVMWRGIQSSGGLNDIPPPLEFPDMGYASMSHNPNQSLNGFAGYSKITGNKVLFRVRIPAGTNAAFISRRSSISLAMKDEAEVIAARGTRFKYISTSENVSIGGGYQKVDVIEVEIVQDNGGNI